MSTHAWATLSNQGVAAAAIVYFLALLAHLVEWSALLGRSSAPGADAVGTPTASEPLVASLLPTQDAASLRAAPVAPLRSAPSGSHAADEPPASGGPDDDRSLRAEMFGRLGYLLTVIAVACHIFAITCRGIAAGRVPWGNMYEFTVAGTCIVGLVYVALYPKFKLSWMAPAVVAFNLVFLMIAVLVLYTPVEDLTEALHSYWLVIHVIAAALATGAFTLGGIASGIYLVKARWPEKDTGWLARVPSLAALDRTAYRIHAFGFPIWTFAVLITGPIWAHQAWGSYWNWDPKEVWAFITWVVYAGYLHARATAGWKGRNAAILALVALATLWFNFIGINYFSSSSMHSYADGIAAVAGARL